MGSTDTAVAVVGSYNVGLTMRVPTFPDPGETIVGHEFAEGPGGKGSNQAIAAARFGAESRFVGRIGEDRYGDDALTLWDREGVGVDGVTRDPAAHTGVGFVIVNDDRENEITVAPGANDCLSAADVRVADETIRSAESLLVQLEIGDEAVAAAVEIADRAGLDVVCNPAPARELPATILEHVDYITPNEHEARTLVGSEEELNDEELAHELLDLGVETVVLTRGDEGALLVTAEDVEAVAAPDVEVVDTTGAGDAFNGVFAVALAEERSNRKALRTACAAGGIAVTESEVVPGLPERAAVEELLDTTW